MASPSSHTYALSAAQAETLEQRLRDGTYELHEVPHARVAARKPGLSVTLYTKGPKVVVQGKSCADFITFVLEPEILGEARLGYEEAIDPAQYEPHFGIDECGKGDFFGPLVVAGIYTDADAARQLIAAGITDSKRVTSDKRIHALAATITSTPGIHYNILVIPPEKYNALYARINNLNRLLAWGHARVIENLLDLRPDCPRALSDQFAANPRTLKAALMERGRGIVLEQRTKAESDVAVAAASILARARFIDWFDRVAREQGVQLPKGAGPQVIAAGKAWLAVRPPGELTQVAKLHFKTASLLTE